MPPIIQEPINLARPDAELQGVVKILHPDYSAAENTLLHLAAVDDGGIDYDTALVACGIVAGNKWTGFLATRNTTAALVPVPRPSDGILRGRSAYFFQLPDSDAPQRPYPVVVRFSDWVFPHSSLPSPWCQLRRSPSNDDATCRVTDSGWALEKAHLVPLSVQSWFDREELEQYAPSVRYSQGGIDADDNLLSLRSDIHKVFDEKIFAIVPKRDTCAVEHHGSLERGLGREPPEPARDPHDTLKLVLHIFKPLPDPYFNRRYHNRRLLLFRCSKEYLFARFAWTILSPGIIGLFLSKCVSRRQILVYDAETGSQVTESRSPEQTHALLKATQSRSSSPRKRVALDTTQRALRTWSESTDCHESQTDSGFHDDTTSPRRGRRRKRSESVHVVCGEGSRATKQPRVNSDIG